MPATRAQAVSLAIWGELLLLGFLWGGSFYFARIAVEHIPPLTLVLFRVAIAGLALHIWLLASRADYAPFRRRLPQFMLLGLLNNAIPFSLMFAGQTAIGAGLASILNATTPVWTILVANAFTADEKLDARKVAGIALGLVGVAILIGPDALTGLGAPAWAQLSLVGCAMSYGVAAVYARRFRDVPPPVTAVGQLTSSTAIMLPVALAVHGVPQVGAVPLPVWAAVLALALVSTAFAYILYFRIIRAAGATNASIVTLLVPASAILLGAALLGERLSVTDLAGMASVAVGLLVLDGRVVRLFSGSPKT